MEEGWIAGMFDRLTVPAREIMVTAKVALRRGSSQQGIALRANVGCKVYYKSAKAHMNIRI